MQKDPPVHDRSINNNFQNHKFHKFLYMPDILSGRYFNIDLKSDDDFINNSSFKIKQKILFLQNNDNSLIYFCKQDEI